MSGARPERHLAAIVVADVVGYGRLISRNESATLDAFKRRRDTIIDPLAAQFKGRAVKFMGDGVLLEFASAVDAVEFAITLQTRLRAVNEAETGQDDILFRIGINLGDVVADGGDVFGEGVNIAARLEAMAEPGGVLISDSIYRQVKGRVASTFKDLGELSLKNVSDPVRVYVAESPQDKIDHPRPPTDRAGIAPDDKISIAVLPFDNMSSSEEAYFSDGITEDIITELSRFPELRVIARNSSFQFRGGRSDIREVGKNLGAKFIIEGSIRRAANRIRITVQLIDAASQGHIWSDRYDRDMVDVFDIQEEIARTVAVRVAGKMRASTVERAKAKPTESLSAYDLFLKARQLDGSYEDDLEQEQLLLKVIELDPQFATAYALLAGNYGIQFLHTGDAKFVQMAVDQGRKALAINREDAWANYSLGLALIYRRSMSEAGFYLQRALDLNPNDVTFLAIHALWLSYAGRNDDALDAINEAIKRDPHGQEWFWDIQGIVFTIQGMYAEAARSFVSMASLPCWTRCFLAFCLTKSGDSMRAATVLSEFRVRNRDIAPSTLMDAILPDTNQGFRIDLIETLQRLEVALPVAPRPASA